MTKVFFILNLIFLAYSLKADSSFDKANETIQLRKTAMQGLWERIIRLSPYVELNEKIEYGKDLAQQDAKEIERLLKMTKSMWPSSSNLSARGYTNATPAVWALPDYFEKLYSSAENASKSLKIAINKDNIKSTELAMCNLGKACGSCHANFRRLLTSQLANEVSGWSGQYIKGCK